MNPWHEPPSGLLDEGWYFNRGPDETRVGPFSTREEAERALYPAPEPTPDLLKDRFGCYLTIHATHATLAFEALRAFLVSYPVRLVRAPIAGDHDWMSFALTPTKHVAARTFLAGWEAGRQSHYR